MLRSHRADRQAIAGAQAALETISDRPSTSPEGDLHSLAISSETQRHPLLKTLGLEDFDLAISIKLPEVIAPRNIAIVVQLELATGPLIVDRFARAH